MAPKGRIRARKVRGANRGWLQNGVIARIIEIRRRKVDIIESENEIVLTIKKAHAYDRRKAWKQLRKDFEDIKRMRIAA